MAKAQFAHIGLNLHKPWNNSFFDQHIRLHLTKQNPIGVITENQLTPQILTSLKGLHPTLLDLDGVIDIENKCFREFQDFHQPVSDQKNDQIIEPESEVSDQIIEHEEISETDKEEAKPVGTKKTKRQR